MEIEGELIAYFTSIVPTTIPVTMPIVARPSPTSSSSPASYFMRTGVRPASVPCPPAKAISMSAPALLLNPKTGSSSNSVRTLATANWPPDMMPAMMTCEPEMFQIVLTGGNRSPRRSAAHITLIRTPGSVFQTANVAVEKMPSPPVNRPTPSGPSARARNPPITAVGMKRSRSGRDHRRISAAPAKTSERTTSDRPKSSALPSMHIPPVGCHTRKLVANGQPCNYRRNHPADCRRLVKCLAHTTSRG